MRKILVFFLKNSELILLLYNVFFKLKNKKLYNKENEKRKSLSIFDYKDLAQAIPYYPVEKMRDSNYYGYALALKTYAGVNKINAALEHGLYLGNRISVAEKYRTTKSVIAMSQNRIDSFKKHCIDKPIIAIGPYIHYAEPLLSEDEFKRIKQIVGKVLLVMPVHAAKGTMVAYNHKILLDFIQSVQHEYDTVMVCVHFRDILNDSNCVSDYEALGYRIVCAGNEYDYNFIRRLKSIIQLSDYVLSNSHGTNTGFCTYLNKPQTIIYDKDLVKIHNAYSDDVKKIRDDQVNEIEGAFSEYSNEITDKQREIVDKYWGISLIKSQEELKRAIESLNSKCPNLGPQRILSFR